MNRSTLILCAAVGLGLAAGLLVTSCGDDDPTSPQNRPPEITSFLADPGLVEPAGISTVTCTAGDPDEDGLTFTWSASAGEISGTGSTVSWLGPLEAGPCTVSVTVDDGQGGSDADTTTVEVGGGTLLVQTGTQVLAVDMWGNHSTFYESGRKIEVAGDRIYLDVSGISEISHSGTLIENIQRPAEAPAAYTDFAALPQGGFVFMENGGDTLTFVTSTGDFIENVVMPEASSINQGVSGVVVGDRLIIAETGTQKLVEVDLATREAAVFRDFSHLGKWLNDIDHDRSVYYMVKGETLYRFTETGDEEELFEVTDGLVLGLAVVGRYAYCTDRWGGAIYRVDIMTGEGGILVEELDNPRDLEFLPVALAAP